MPEHTEPLAAQGPAPLPEPSAAQGPAPLPEPSAAQGPAPLPEPSAEDAKLVTLARASRARTGAAAGAAVRDQDGRTYAAAEVALPSLALDALSLAVAMAVSSGATSLEAAAVVADALPGLDPVRDVAGAGVPVLRAEPSGRVVETVTT